jgi:hypothetical protein
LPMKMEQSECSKTSAYKIRTPRNYPEENIRHRLFAFLQEIFLISYIFLLLYVHLFNIEIDMSSDLKL